MMDRWGCKMPHPCAWTIQQKRGDDKLAYSFSSPCREYPPQRLRTLPNVSRTATKYLAQSYLRHLVGYGRQWEDEDAQALGLSIKGCRHPAGNAEGCKSKWDPPSGHPQLTDPKIPVISVFDAILTINPGIWTSSNRLHHDPILFAVGIMLSCGCERIYECRV